MARRGPNNGGEKRDRILRAAVTIFSRKGFFNSKVSEVARAASVADGTIYLYFRNKDDLLISLSKRRWGRWWRTFAGESPTAGTPWKS